MILLKPLADYRCVKGVHSETKPISPLIWCWDDWAISYFHIYLMKVEQSVLISPNYDQKGR